MKKSRNRFGSLIIASFSIVGFFGFTDFASASVNSETRKAATRAGASHVAEVSFSKESTTLSDGAKDELKEAITKAGKNGEIKEVKVVAWSDQEYPAKGVSLADSQIDLAEKRAESIQSYLKESLKLSDVSIMNMAKRPNAVQKVLNTPDAKAKNIMENSGAAPTNSDETGLFGLKGKTSEAVIMIYYKK